MASADVVMAGFGGQGLLAIGKILAKAAMEEGRNVTWLPSYGPEMRGGTANCVVIIDDEPIGSPVLKKTRAALVMNKQSIDKFEPQVAPGGLLVVNTSLIEAEPTRTDIEIVLVPCTQIAKTAGDDKLVSVVALGALLARRGLVRPVALRAAIEAIVSKKRPQILQADLAAFEAGFNAAAGVPAGA